MFQMFSTMGWPLFHIQFVGFDARLQTVSVSLPFCLTKRGRTIKESRPEEEEDG